jgi:hypothetical protein
MAFDVAAAKKAGYTDTEIAQFLATAEGFDVQKAKQAGYTDADIIGFLSDRAKPKPARGPVEEVGRQVGLTVRAGAQGLARLAGIVTDPITAGLNAVLPESMQMQPVRQAVGNLLTSAGVPQPETSLERVVGQAAETVAGAGGTIGTARTLATALTGTPQSVAGMMAAQPVQQLTGAAGAGAGAQTAQEVGAGPVGQIAASLAGGVAGARLAAPRGGAPVPVPGVVREAEQIGVPLMTTDVRAPTTFTGKFVQASGERIPGIGTGPVRAAQEQARVAAVRDFARQYGADDLAQASDVVMRDLANKRGAMLTKYTGLKGEVINRLAGAPVPVPKATAAFDDEIARLQAANLDQLAPAIKTLDDFKTALQNQDLPNIELIRRQLGTQLADPSLASVKDELQKASGRIYRELNADMGDFIRANGEARDLIKWRVANARLSEMIGETKRTALKSALQRGEETPEVVRQLLFSQKPSDVRALYANLTPTGRAAARTAIVQEAFKKAGGEDALIPTRFANEVKRLGASTGVFFTGDDAARIEGLARVLNATRRAGEAAAAPPTGVQVALPVGAAVLADVMGSGGAAILTGATIGAVSRIYESAPVRDALLKLARTKPNTPEEAALVKRTLAAIQASATTEPETP